MNDLSMNLDEALNRLNGDKSLLLDLIGFYLEDYPMLLTNIASGMEQANFKEIERGAHSLKGLVANFSAFTAQEAASELETAAKSHDYKPMPELVAKLQLLLEELGEKLKSFRDQSNANL